MTATSFVVVWKLLLNSMRVRQHGRVVAQGILAAAKRRQGIGNAVHGIDNVVVIVEVVACGLIRAG